MDRNFTMLKSLVQVALEREYKDYYGGSSFVLTDLDGAATSVKYNDVQNKVAEVIKDNREIANRLNDYFDSDLSLANELIRMISEEARDGLHKQLSKQPQEVNHTRGTWKHDRIRFDLDSKELAAQLTGIIQGVEKPLEQPKQNLSPEKMTVDQFAQKIQQQLKDAAEDVKSLADLLKAKVLMPNMKAEGIVAIRMQRPDAQHVASAQDWRKLGYRLNAGEFGKAIKVITSYKEQSFVIDGKTIPVSQASDDERQKILTGALPVQESIKTKMQMVYDVTQTDCPPTEYALLNRPEIQNIDVEQRYELMRSLMMDKGVNCISDKAMTILDATGYYDPDKNEIHIADSLKDYQKLSALCDCSAACIVNSTTVQTEPIETFEAAYLALQLKQYVGVPIDEAQYAHVAGLYMQIPDRPVKSLDEALTRCQRANAFVSKELQEMYRGFMQAQGMDMSMLGTQVAQNFIQDLS